MGNSPIEQDPWQDAETRYTPGQAVQGSVSRVTHFGVFVQVEPRLEGIVYTFELGTSTAAFTLDQQMQLYIKSIDPGKKRLELSLHPPSTLSPLLVDTLPPTLRQEARTNNQVPPAFSPLPTLPGIAANWMPPLPTRTSNQLTDMPFLPEIRANHQQCPTCQNEVQASWKYCVYCRTQLRYVCPDCSTSQPILPAARYCCECGQELRLTK